MAKLGIEKFTEEEIEEMSEGKLDWFNKQAWNYSHQKDWKNYDRVIEESEALSRKFLRLQDHPFYGDCISDQIYSHFMRGDKPQLLKALQRYKTTKYDGNVLVAKRYIFFAFYCLVLELSGEAFEMIARNNCFHITAD